VRGTLATRSKVGHSTFHLVGTPTRYDFFVTKLLNSAGGRVANPSLSTDNAANFNCVSQRVRVYEHSTQFMSRCSFIGIANVVTGGYALQITVDPNHDVHYDDKIYNSLDSSRIRLMDLTIYSVDNTNNIRADSPVVMFCAQGSPYDAASKDRVASSASRCMYANHNV
jgi:hypothetical protein